jgi:hypothetical protein
MTRREFPLIALTAALGLVVAAAGDAAPARTSRVDHLTFSGPIGLPGVSLAAGTYTFLALEGHPDIVRVQNHDGSAVYFTGFTRLVRRPAGLREDRTVTFAESPRGTPPRVDTWYPSASATGRQFIYANATN